MDGDEVKVRVENLSKVFTKGKKSVVAIRDFTLDIADGEFVCLLGPSGCGKTTVLRMIAGLESKSSGSIRVQGKEVVDAGPDRGMVFQEFALFPWRSASRNVEFGLEVKGVPESERKEVSEHFFSLVGLEGFEESLPKQLSGGMKQRVAIARALANNPAVLLMDEPFGSLDAQTRNLMQKELLRIWLAERKTVIFVTHSVDEAVFLADRIVIMTARPGKVREVIEITLPRPRDRTSPEFISVRGEVLAELEEEFEKAREKELSPD
jgi:NitT/TauT family transport system ATP-binding protein